MTLASYLYKTQLWAMSEAELAGAEAAERTFWATVDAEEANDAPVGILIDNPPWTDRGPRRRVVFEDDTQ